MLVVLKRKTPVGKNSLHQERKIEDCIRKELFWILDPVFSTFEYEKSPNCIHRGVIANLDPVFFKLLGSEFKKFSLRIQFHRKSALFGTKLGSKLTFFAAWIQNGLHNLFLGRRKKVKSPPKTKLRSRGGRGKAVEDQNKIRMKAE